MGWPMWRSDAAAGLGRTRGHLHRREPRARPHSFGGFVLTAIEGAYIRGRAEHTTTAFREAGEWLARLANER
jgi:hypothetical protein